MYTLDEKLHDWIRKELKLVSKGFPSEIPEPSKLSHLTEGKKLKKVWNYIIENVRSRSCAQKIKHILSIKRITEENMYPPIIELKDRIKSLRGEITKASERRIFLESTLSQAKDFTVSSQGNIRTLKEEIDKVNQMCAFLESTYLKCGEKYAYLKTIEKNLAGCALERYSSGDATVFIDEYFHADKLHVEKMDYLLNHVACLVMNKLQNNEVNNMLIMNLIKMVGERIKFDLLCDLFRGMRDRAKKLYMDGLWKITSDSNSLARPPSRKKLLMSDELLREAKLCHVQNTFNFKRTQIKINHLCKARTTLIEAKFYSHGLSIADQEFEKKCQLLDRIAENKGLKSGIEFLEEALCSERNKTKQMLEENKEQMLRIQNLDATVQKFYESFDTLYYLINLNAEAHVHISKRLLDLRSFANEHVFSNLDCTIKDYPFQLQNKLTLEDETVLKVFIQKDIIHPLVRDPISKEWQVSDVILRTSGIATFQNTKIFGEFLKQLKEAVLENCTVRFIYKDDSCGIQLQYNKMFGMLQQAHGFLEEGNVDVDNAVKNSGPVAIALQEWQEQGAQFIPDIEYQDKSLGMWLAVLKLINL